MKVMSILVFVSKESFRYNVSTPFVGKETVSADTISSFNIRAGVIVCFPIISIQPERNIRRAFAGALRPEIWPRNDSGQLIVYFVLCCRSDGNNISAPFAVFIKTFNPANLRRRLVYVQEGERALVGIEFSPFPIGLKVNVQPWADYS